jgi:hypothetical protein
MKTANLLQCCEGFVKVSTSTHVPQGTIRNVGSHKTVNKYILVIHRQLKLNFMSCRHKPSYPLLVYNQRVLNKVCYRSVHDVLQYGIRYSYSVCRAK